MKGKLLVLTLAVLLTAGGASFAFAMSPHAGAEGRRGDGGCEMQRGKTHAAMAALLGLTEKQQAQIKSIIAAARQTNKPLREKLANDREKVEELSKATPFDEAARTDLAVERLKVKNEIQAVLSPEQREKAKELRLLMHGKHGGMGHGFHRA